MRKASSVALGLLWRQRASSSHLLQLDGMQQSGHVWRASSSACGWLWEIVSQPLEPWTVASQGHLDVEGHAMSCLVLFGVRDPPLTSNNALVSVCEKGEEPSRFLDLLSQQCSEAWCPT